MKRAKTLVLAVVLVLSLVLCACAKDSGDKKGSSGNDNAGTTNTSSGPIKVGVVNNPPSESGYREANVKDMEAVFSKANGYDLKTAYSLKNDDQLQAAQGFITEGVDYLLISAAETTGWDDVLKKAKEAGIKVFLFDRMIDVDESLYEAAVVSDMAKEGETAVKWLLDQNLSEYNVIHIQGAMGSDAQIGRTGALDEQFASKKMNKVVQQTATWDEAEAKKIVESVINSKASFNVIYAENDGMAKGAVAALDDAGITHGVDGQVIVMGFDCNKWALRELLAGKWNYDGQCSPFQAQIISDIIQGKKTVTSKKIINEEKGFDAKSLTQADIDNYGLGE
ncbi:MAG: substrate-binding domain-containing protein [Lachnospiraceae bacterium]|jgi:simple sugar transport system substrate-binding protein|nr:substrate-binding domain-containing protein [Lachnospiraceae bacterium]MBQ6026705.1 substrate-binding domain-containing protein [Lachnospiraceae bacterium]